MAALPGDHMRAGMGRPESARELILPELEIDCGRTLRHVRLAYNTYGRLNAARDNAILICHSLTSNSCVHEWWAEMLGAGPAFALDTGAYFCVCVNYLGSVYGSESPVSVNPETGAPHSASFPQISLRDNVRAQHAVLAALGVSRLCLCIGASMGGMAALEWAVMYPDFVGAIATIAACARNTSWAIGLGELQRQAIYADPAWRGGWSHVGYEEKFSRAPKPARTGPRTGDGHSTPDDGSDQSHTRAAAHDAPAFDVESYLHYQGDKFVQRFDALAYVRLTQTLDTHDLGAGRGTGDYRDVLRTIRVPTFITGIESDILYPLSLQQEMAALIPHAHLHTVFSPHGHDSFLIEIKALNVELARWMNAHVRSKVRPPKLDTARL